MMPELESSHFGDNESHGIASEKSEISNAMLPQKTKLKTTNKQEADDPIVPPTKPISKKLTKKKKLLRDKKTNVEKA